MLISWAQASAAKAVVRSRVQGGVHQVLGEGERAGRPGGEALGPLLGGGGELGVRDDAVDQAHALGVGGPQRVPEEHQLLRPLRPDQAGQQIGAAAVRHQAPADEHLDELGRFGGQDQIAGEREVGAEAGGGAVDRRDHRLLAVEYGRDQALGALADRAGDVAGDPLAAGRRRRRPRAGRLPRRNPCRWR